MLASSSLLSTFLSYIVIVEVVVDFNVGAVDIFVFEF